MMEPTNRTVDGWASWLRHRRAAEIMIHKTARVVPPEEALRRAEELYQLGREHQRTDRHMQQAREAENMAFHEVWYKLRTAMRV